MPRRHLIALQPQESQRVSRRPRKRLFCGAVVAVPSQHERGRRAVTRRGLVHVASALTLTSSCGATKSGELLRTLADVGVVPSVLPCVTSIGLCNDLAVEPPPGLPRLDDTHNSARPSTFPWSTAARGRGSFYAVFHTSSSTMRRCV